MEFTRIEKAAIEAILSKPVDGMEIVREQFAAASAVERDHTRVGFYTTISVPRSLPLMPDSKQLRDELFDGAAGRTKSDPGGLILFQLWTSDGYLSCLEGYTIRKAWPHEDDIEGIRPLRTASNASRPVRHVRSSDDDLIPDCENRFEVWRMNTSSRSLLAAGLLILLLVVVVLVVIAIVV